MSTREETREKLIEQLAEGFSKERHRINAQGNGHLPDDLEQYAADLLDWANIAEEGHTPESLKLLYLLGASLQFYAADCEHCGDRFYIGRPDGTDGLVSWDDFQGANQNECYLVCDHCHMHYAEAREIEGSREG